MKAWHFIKADRKLGYGDRRTVVDGETLHYLGDDPIKLRARGLHFSVNVLDALYYAPGPIACYVDVPDDAILGVDKGVAVSRTVIKSIDATEIVVKFAILEAKAVYKEPTWTKWADDWLSGVDRSAASSAFATFAAGATYAFAAYAAHAAALVATRAAARAVDADAAVCGAINAINYAANAVADFNATNIKQNETLESMLFDAMGIAK